MKEYRFTSMTQNAEHTLSVAMAGMQIYVSSSIGSREAINRELRMRQIDIFSSLYDMRNLSYGKGGRLVTYEMLKKKRRSWLVKDSLSVQEIERIVDGLLYGPANGSEDFVNVS